jgi:hypothetical protein
MSVLLKIIQVTYTNPGSYKDVLDRSNKEAMTL